MAVRRGAGGVELLEGFGFDQFGFGRREVGGGEFGPVSDRAVDDAGGADGDGVVGGGAGLDGRAVGFVAAGLVVLARVPGGPKPAVVMPERAEDLFAHEVFPGFAGDLLGHVAGDRDAGVGVDVLRAGSGFGRFGRDALRGGVGARPWACPCTARVCPTAHPLSSSPGAPPRWVRSCSSVTAWYWGSMDFLSSGNVSPSV